MIKRLLTFVLAAALLLSTAPAVISADEGSLAVDAPSGCEIANGVVKIDAGTNASELLSCFTSRDAVLTAADGTVLTLSDAVGSGAAVSLGTDSVTVIVTGDVTGDAKISVRDAVSAMKALLGSTQGIYAAAADVDADGEITSRDIIKLMRYLVGWDETLTSAIRAAAANDDSALRMYFVTSMLRVAREDTTVYGPADGLIRMAKNEIEDAHIILTSAEEKRSLTFEVGDIVNKAGDVLEREVRYGYYYKHSMFNDLNSQDYLNFTDASWADPYPVLSGAFDMGANESQSFIVKVKTASATAAGWYSAPVRVLDSDGREVKKATLRVYVWDFAIDNTKLSYTTFGTGSGISTYFGEIDEKYYNAAIWKPYYKIWYDYVLENKMNLHELPYDISDPNVDEYLDDERVTSFVTLSGKNADPWSKPETVSVLAKTYDKLKQKEEWLEKAYIYTVDEPWNESGADAVKIQWNSAKELLGDTFFQTIVPYYNNWLAARKTDLTEELWDYCNAFCPDANVFTPYADRRTRKDDPDMYPVWATYMDDAQYAKYGPFEPRYQALRERGDKMWWYICVTPVFPHANFYNTYQGAWARVVLWQQYRYNSDGFLYWSMSMWNLGEKNNNKINLNRTGGGDGLLLYPGTLWYDEPLPVPSIRFEIVRDGFEDFAYLRQLEKALGRDKVLEYTNRVTTDILHFSQDWHDIDSVRDEIGFVLESLGK